MAESLLSFRERGQGPVLVILHGLFGYGRNWWSMARHLSKDFRVILPDLRNHGDSFQALEHNYRLMAEDLERLILSQEIPQFHLVGHSMGGKVAMRYAFDYPDKLLSLTVLDITPKVYASEDHAALLRTLQSLDLATLASRADADQAIANEIPEPGLRQFLLSNLVRTEAAEAGWEWQINLPVLADNLSEITGKLELPTQPFRHCPVHFVRGERSEYIRPQDLPLIQSYFPAASLDCLADAGHWLQADQPQALTALLRQYLGNQKT